MLAATWRIDTEAHPGTAGVTWTGSAKRLLDARCVSCHHERGASPRLDDYASARDAAPAIRDAVLARHAPGWSAVGAAVDFVNDPRPTPHEIELLASWADGRAPYGYPAADTEVPAASSPAPDLTLTVPEKYAIVDRAHVFRLLTRESQPREIRGWVFRPGNTARVTGAAIAIGRGPVIGTWRPGDGATFLPEGTAQPLDAGVEIRLTVFYNASPDPGVDASELGLYFAPSPSVLMPVQHRTLPCGSSVTHELMQVISVRPVIGPDARSLRILARHRDGTVVVLGEFSHVRGDSTTTYQLRHPPRVPSGSTITVEGAPGCGVDVDFVTGTRDLPPLTVAASPSAASTAPAVPLFWCAMHPNVQSAERGSCPQCGMTLVPMVPSREGSYDLQTEVIERGAGGGLLRLTVRDPRTAAIVRDFETVHERPFHLFLVSPDLGEFFHVHPVATADGALEVASLPLRSARMEIFADFLPQGGTPQLIHRTVLRKRSDAEAAAPGLVVDLAEKIVGGLRIRLAPEEEQVVAGRPTLIDVRLEDAVTGAAADDLQPYLGAWGHAFILSEDLTSAVHSHPLTPVTRSAGGTIIFQQRFPHPGLYRIWLQVMRHGEVMTIPFTVPVM